jgi:hypothetical protein
VWFDLSLLLCFKPTTDIKSLQALKVLEHPRQIRRKCLLTKPQARVEARRDAEGGILRGIQVRNRGRGRRRVNKAHASRIKCVDVVERRRYQDAVGEDVHVAATSDGVVVLDRLNHYLLVNEHGFALAAVVQRARDGPKRGLVGGAIREHASSDVHHTVPTDDRKRRAIGKQKVRVVGRNFRALDPQGRRRDQSPGIKIPGCKLIGVGDLFDGLCRAIGNGDECATG